METKRWYRSKTCWATMLIVIITVLRMSARQDTARTIEQEAEIFGEWAGDFVTLILAGLGFIGRMTAKTTLTK